eukprot:13184325-Heterocapsa_arctica.AAC.1
MSRRTRAGEWPVESTPVRPSCPASGVLRIFGINLLARPVGPFTVSVFFRAFCVLTVLSDRVS